MIPTSRFHRLKALETQRAQQYGDSVRVIHRGVDDTDEQAIHRKGGELLVIIVSFVKPGQLLRLPLL